MADKRYPCGFCSTGNHNLCPVFIKNATNTTPDRTWYCICAENSPENHFGKEKSATVRLDNHPDLRYGDIAANPSQGGKDQMAQHEVVTYQSDLSGKETDGQNARRLWDHENDRLVELDLTEQEALAFDKVVSKYLDKSHPVNVRKTNSGNSNPSRTSAIRAWAKSQGIQVGARGRFPNGLEERYDAAQANQNSSEDAS